MTTRKRTPGGIPASALAANITAGATSLTLTTGDGTNWPSTFPYDIIVNRASSTSRERITVAGKTGDVLNSLTRGIDGTTAQAHNLGDSVEIAVAGTFLDELGQLLGGTAGDLYYYDGTALQKLAKGTAEQMLKQGASAPSWSWQALPKFASTAARTTANAAPADGDASYLNAGDSTEGPEFYNGTSWRKPWNMPWGHVVTPASVTANVTGVTTATDSGLSVTFTPLATRRYQITYSGALESSVAGDIARFHLTDQNSIVLLQRDVVCSTANSGDYRTFVEDYNSSGPTGFKVRVTRASGTGNIKFSASATSPGRLSVVDMGPSGAPA